MQDTDRNSRYVQRVLQGECNNFYLYFGRVKDDLQVYSKFRKYLEAEEKHTVALLFLLVIVVRINTTYICTRVNAINFTAN